MAITFLKFLLFLATAVSAGFWTFGTTKEQNQRGYERTRVTYNTRRLIASVGTLLSLLLVFPSIGYVEAGYRGVVLRFGAVTERVLGEGIYLVKPIVESVVQMNVQVQAEARAASASSQDMQIVQTEVTLNYFLDPAQVAHVYQSLRQDYTVRVIDPAIQEAVKAATAQFDAEELITKRPQVSAMILKFLTDRLGSRGIHIDAMSLTDFKFSDDFNNSIEAKVTATQLALKAENDLRRINIEAEQRVATATAEAEAIRIQAKAIADQGGDAYVALKWVEKWNGQPPQIMTGGQGSSLLFQLPASK